MTPIVYPTNERTPSLASLLPRYVPTVVENKSSTFSCTDDDAAEDPNDWSFFSLFGEVIGDVGDVAAVVAAAGCVAATCSYRCFTSPLCGVGTGIK